MDYNCVECGACCASFRVDFHPSDGEAQGGRVPEGLYDELNVSIARIRGTDDAQPRCRALRGRIHAGELWPGNGLDTRSHSVSWAGRCV